MPPARSRVRSRTRAGGPRVFGFLAIDLVLSVFFLATFSSHPATGLSAAGKALWTVALLVVPVFAWIEYGIWRMRSSRGL